MNREQWLGSALVIIRNHLRDSAAIVLPDTVRVSCGFPAGAGTKRGAIGQCWAAECSADAHHEIFISPTIANPIDVLATLVHEAIHASLPASVGHKGPFKQAMIAAGLEGKPTATVASEQLKIQLNGWLRVLGEYPHAQLVPGSGKKKQSTRLIKCTCAHCGYTVRTTQKWIDYSGAPLCPTESCRDDDGEMPRMSVEVAEEGDSE